MKNKTFPVKIGLEVHGYLNTKEKLFCKCCSTFEKGETPNSKICPICTGQPGSKPMHPNKQAIKRLIQISLILGCKINHDKNLIWQRKHYNWADLPKGYQNTISGAYSVPVSEKGKYNGADITECHLEEDPAQWNPETGGVNYNRSGIALVEIVTEPDFSNSEQVAEWLKNLVHSLSYIRALRKNAGIKVDVNVSTYGERVEMKNLNSIEKIKKAIEYEIERQVENHEKGIVQKRETLAFDDKSGKTIKMREKESAQDYRFIPDPDLPIIKLNEKEIEKIKKEIPETPNDKLEKLLKKYKLDKKNADILSKNIELVVFFEELSKHVDAVKYISWISIELLRVLNYNKKTLEDEDVDVKPEHLAGLIELVDKNKITVLKAKQIMNSFIPKSFSVKEAEDIGKIQDSEIDSFCRKVISENKKAVEDFKSGNKNSLNFLIGEVMKVSNRRADFKTAKECILRVIK